MEPGLPSRTAMAAARHRAAHQILEKGRIFTDRLALQILGEEPASVVRWAEEGPSHTRTRLFIAVRSRFAEDALNAAVERGTRQLIVLGAGLDTCAYRNRFPDNLRVFEVDRPDTQTWKRSRTAEAGIPLPLSLTFAPVDFERQRLADGLGAAGFDPEQQSFFTWLGVVPYLTDEAIWSTLAFIAGLSKGADVVFDYSNPPDSLSPELRARHDSRAERVAALGEPFISYFDEDDLRERLTGLGFNSIEDLGPRQIASRYFPNRAGHHDAKGGHILHATTLRNVAGTAGYEDTR